MVWYPSVDDVIDANITALELSGDRHPPKLRRSRKAIEALIEEVKSEEARSLTYQAAKLMRGLVHLHAFDSGNHRTAYAVAKMLLRRNGRHFRVEKLEQAYPFIKNIRNKTIEEVKEWIERGTAEEPKS